MNGELGWIILICLLNLPSCIVCYNESNDHTPNRIEERAKKAYSDSRNKIGWYKNGAHLEPWEKITQDEKEIWKSAVDHCGHGESKAK